MGMGMNANAKKQDAAGAAGAAPDTAKAGSKKKDVLAGAEGFDEQEQKLSPDAGKKKDAKAPAGG